MTPKITKLPVSERSIQNSIIEYLQLKGWYVHRINSGMIPMSYKGKQRMIRLGSGMPDLMAFKENLVPVTQALPLKINSLKLLFIEVKIPGKDATPIQKAKMEELEVHGARCLTIHSLEELQTELQ